MNRAFPMQSLRPILYMNTGALLPDGVDTIMHPVLVLTRVRVPLPARNRFADLIIHLVLILPYSRLVGPCLVAIWTYPLPMTSNDPLALVLTALLNRLRTALHPSTHVKQLIG